MRLRILLLPLLCAAAFSRLAFASPEQWIQIQSPHFAVISDANEKQARHITAQFERMRWLFQTLFPKFNVDPAEPIVVIAVKNENGFRALEPAAYLGKGKLDLAGYFLDTSDKKYVLLRLDASSEHPFATIYHEYTHLQFRADEAWMPIWLNEGLAEYIQNTEFRDKDVQLGEPSTDDILYLRQNATIPLPVLFKVDQHSPYYHDEQKGSVFYAESWALTHMIMIDDRLNHTHRLDDYVALVQGGADPVSAAQSAFGDLKKLESNLSAYIRASSYKYFVVSSAMAPIDESTYKLQPLTQNQADAWRADLLAGVQRTDDARALLQSVLQADPKNVQAMEAMGSVELRAGQRDEALRWYRQAVDLNSQDFLAQYYFAMLTLRAGAPGDDEAKQVEASLRAAIKLNPQFAPSFDALASLLLMRSENLDEAHTLGIRAIELDPANLGYRMNAASVMMRMDRPADALHILAIAQRLAKTSDQTAAVQERIADIQRFQSARAEAEANAAANARVVSTSVEAQPASAEPQAVSAPRHPTMPGNGTTLWDAGVIHSVKCDYPSVIEFRVESPKKTITVYNNDFFKIGLTAVGFTPSGTINPCFDFEGRNVRIGYLRSSDTTVDGQVVTVEMHK